MYVARVDEIGYSDKHDRYTWRNHVHMFQMFGLYKDRDLLHQLRNYQFPNTGPFPALVVKKMSRNGINSSIHVNCLSNTCV